MRLFWQNKTKENSKRHRDYQLSAWILVFLSNQLQITGRLNRSLSSSTFLFVFFCLLFLFTRSVLCGPVTSSFAPWSFMVRYKRAARQKSICIYAARVTIGSLTTVETTQTTNKLTACTDQWKTFSVLCRFCGITAQHIYDLWSIKLWEYPCLIDLKIMLIFISRMLQHETCIHDHASDL